MGAGEKGKVQEGDGDNGSPFWTHSMLEVEGILAGGEIEAQRGKVTCLMSYDFLFCGMAHWVLYRSSPCDCVCKESKGIKKWVTLGVVQKEHWAWSLPW